jgi:hypothetical protein
MREGHFKKRCTQTGQDQGVPFHASVHLAHAAGERSPLASIDFVSLKGGVGIDATHG